MRVGFIGTGRITRRLVRGLDAAAHDIAVTRRSESVSSELAAAIPGLAVIDDAQQVVDRSDAVFLCLAADVAHALVPGLTFRPDQAVISVMAGVSRDALRTATEPAGEVCVTIPMPSVEHGGCPLPVHPRSETLETLYGERNPIIPVRSEQELQPFWAVAGTMSSVLAELQVITEWLAAQHGDADAAERYVTNMYAGYLDQLTHHGPGALTAALADLSIEGGFNATLQQRIRDAGHYDELHAGLDMLLERTSG